VTYEQVKAVADSCLREVEDGLGQMAKGRVVGEPQCVVVDIPKPQLKFYDLIDNSPGRELGALHPHKRLLQNLNFRDV
jgi:exosome complex exonuclease RRP6